MQVLDPPGPGTAANAVIAIVSTPNSKITTIRTEKANRFIKPRLRRIAQKVNFIDQGFIMIAQFKGDHN